MKEKEIEDELVSIRSMMERSSKFISLSGLSGILAGVYALVGAWGGYYFIYGHGNPRPYYAIDGSNFSEREVRFLDIYPGELVFLMSITILVLMASLLTGFILTRRKAKKKGQPIWGNISRALFFNMAVPLASGGVLILILLVWGYFGIVSPVSLIFYGLALIGASNFTFKDVRYLGLCEIILGLIAACLPGFGLLFWAIGFGVLHIIYGSLMYFKYDR